MARYLTEDEINELKLFYENPSDPFPFDDDDRTVVFLQKDWIPKYIKDSELFKVMIDELNEEERSDDLFEIEKRYFPIYWLFCDSEDEDNFEYYWDEFFVNGYGSSKNIVSFFKRFNYWGCDPEFLKKIYGSHTLLQKFSKLKANFSDYNIIRNMMNIIIEKCSKVEDIFNILKILNYFDIKPDNKVLELIVNNPKTFDLIKVQSEFSQFYKDLYDDVYTLRSFFIYADMFSISLQSEEEIFSDYYGTVLTGEDDFQKEIDDKFWFFLKKVVSKFGFYFQINNGRNLHFEDSYENIFNPTKFVNISSENDYILQYIIKTFIEGRRYFLEIVNDNEIIDFIIDGNEEHLVDILLNYLYTGKYDENEYSTDGVRAILLIKIIAKKPEVIHYLNNKYNWMSVEPLGWEEGEEQLEKENIEKEDEKLKRLREIFLGDIKDYMLFIKNGGLENN